MPVCLDGQALATCPLDTTGVLKPTWLGRLWVLETILLRGSLHSATRESDRFFKVADMLS